jgi:two-component system, OmpR family, response regulator
LADIENAIVLYISIGYDDLSYILANSIQMDAILDSRLCPPILKPMPHLLLVEDDDLLRDGLSAQLTQMGHTLTVASNGAVAVHVVDTARFDGVILDLGLPLVDGMAVLRHIRQHHAALPVLVLTARDGVEDRVAGLNAGADDYLTKPFNFAELAARLAAMLRRSQLPAFDGSRATEGLRVHASEPRAWVSLSQGEAELELTQREWSLLTLLVTYRGRVVGREDVLARWHNDDRSSDPLPSADPDNNALEVYIHRLRKKLEGSKLAIRNVRGLGYLLDSA